MTSLRYHAPPVAYPVGRFALLPVCLAWAAVAVCFLQAGRWMQAMSGIDWQWWSALMAGLAILIWLFWAWHRSPQGWLTWAPTEQSPEQLPDGSGWWWTDKTGPVNIPLVRVTRGMRWPGGMWLRLYSAADQPAPRWLWVARADQSNRWLDLLRALQAAT